MSITAKRILALLGLPSSSKNYFRLSSERSCPPNQDRPRFLQVAHHDAVGVPFANRYLIDADHFRSGFARLGQLRFHVLLVELFNRVPVQLEFLGNVVDRGRAT